MINKPTDKSTGKSGGGGSGKPVVKPVPKSATVASPGASPKSQSEKGTTSERPGVAPSKPGSAGLSKKGALPLAASTAPKGGATVPPLAGSKGASSKGPAVAGKGPTGKSSKKSAPETPPTPLIPRKFPKGGPGKAELRKYRAHLLELRRGLLASSKDLASEALKSSSSEFTVDRTPDSGGENYEQDFSLQLLEGEAAQLADIREALLKIDGKTELPFGICEACSDTDKRLCESCPWIPASRLDVMPHARLCVQTKEIEERKKQR